MSKFCVLQLTPTEVCFTVFDERHPVVWVELSKDHFFTEYNLSGFTREDNKIYLEFDAVMLSKSLTSLKAAAMSVKIKLTNKQQPCLTLEIELPSASTDSWQCIHDVPVRMVAVNEWPAYDPPDIPDFDVIFNYSMILNIKRFGKERMVGPDYVNHNIR